MKDDIAGMLLEKSQHYGEKGGFYENNSLHDYSHALGEARLKIGEFLRLGETKDPTLRRRLIVKALTWLYLVYETEIMDGPK